MTTASIASAEFQKGARRPKVAIYEPYVFNTVYGNAHYTSMYFKFIDKTQFSPILISPVECEFLETLGKRVEEWQVVPGPGPLNEFGGKTLTNGLLGNQARYRARRRIPRGAPTILAGQKFLHVFANSMLTVRELIPGYIYWLTNWL